MFKDTALTGAPLADWASISVSRGNCSSGQVCTEADRWCHIGAFAGCGSYRPRTIIKGGHRILLMCGHECSVESVARASANVLRHMREPGAVGKRIVNSGGHTRNPLWLRAKVDAIGQLMHLPSNSNLTILGAVAAAAVGACVAKALWAAATEVAPPMRIIEPDMAAHAQYAKLPEDYPDLTERLAPVSRRLAARQLRGSPHVR